MSGIEKFGGLENERCEDGGVITDMVRDLTPLPRLPGSVGDRRSSLNLSTDILIMSTTFCFEKDVMIQKITKNVIPVRGHGEAKKGSKDVIEDVLTCHYERYSLSLTDEVIK